jgi:hypothetical protein
VKNRFRILLAPLLLFALADLAPANSQEVLIVAEDSATPYSRSAFKHWIDEDKDKCDTRAEVLIEEAVAKPRIDKKKCALIGGSWISPYDNKVQIKASALDVDHLVPLAEAWRSGAWNWTASQRQSFANDLNNPQTLVAVTLSLNRSKGDKDVSGWLPPFGHCSYAESWIQVKVIYKLTVDPSEAETLLDLITSCGITGITIVNSSTQIHTPTLTPTPTSTPTPTPTATTTSATITPGAFCSPAGATGRSSSGVTYTCKTSDNDSRNRWRK